MSRGGQFSLSAEGLAAQYNSNSSTPKPDLETTSDKPASEWMTSEFVRQETSANLCWAKRKAERLFRTTVPDAPGKAPGRPAAAPAVRPSPEAYGDHPDASWGAPGPLPGLAGGFEGL